VAAQLRACSQSSRDGSPDARYASLAKGKWEVPCSQCPEAKWTGADIRNLASGAPDHTVATPTAAYRKPILQGWSTGTPPSLRTGSARGYYAWGAPPSVQKGRTTRSA